MASTVTSKGLSDNTKSIIVIILLVLSLFVPFLFLISFILMWVWIRWPKWVKVLVTVPFVLSIVLFISYFFWRPFQVNGQTMSPTYKNGAYLATKIYHPNSDVIQREDIIVFQVPPDPNKAFIKRVIGISGDRIMIKDGYVYLNGQALQQRYLPIPPATYGGVFLKDNQEIKVPEEQYFVMGDNRQFSSDSREWGFVPQRNIISKVSFCYFRCK